MADIKLFMLMLGCTPPGRHIEQHDIFFAIGTSLNDLVPEIKAFWPEPEKIHIDAWREVNRVEGHSISVVEKDAGDNVSSQSADKLFFINLGGYLENKFEEQHHILLTVKADRTLAFQTAKETLFYQHNWFEGANSHIDDKYGIDVDELYLVDDILSPKQKEKYRIEISPATDLPEDEMHLGYLKLSALE